MKPTLLLVDDNKEMLEVLVEELSEKYYIITARNGRQALELLSQEVIQLIVCDVMMPVMDGFELCITLKSNVEYTHLPLILLTAKNTLQSRIEGLEVGADAYIEKPFDAEHLQMQIANLLSNRNRIKEHFAHSPLVQLLTIAQSRPDVEFLDKLNRIIQDHLEEPEFGIDNMARHMNMSRSNFFRKVKSMSDLTPHELVNLSRLKKAAELFAEGDYKIYEVCDMVGFGSTSNFGRSFFKQFGMTPTDFQKRMQADKNGH